MPYTLTTLSIKTPIITAAASQEAEEDVARGKIKEISEDNKGSNTSTVVSNISKQPKISKKEVKMMRSDTAIGMALSQLIMWAIITTIVGSLHAHNITDIQTADQAAKALQPLVMPLALPHHISRPLLARMPSYLVVAV
jgi:Mn2+/Fe2+ NRAMP family transporter